jgi:hypothetical protein
LSNSNAFKHGLYSDDVVVLDGENQQDFAELRDALLEEYAARSVSEKIAVSELANLFWKKLRLESRLKRAFDKRLAYIEADGRDHDTDASRSIVESHSEAAKIISDRIVEYLKRYVGTQGTGLPDSEVAEFQKFIGLGKEMQMLGKDLFAPIVRFAEERKLKHVEQSFDPDLMERGLKIEAEIDRRIEKVLKRLVMIKHYKEIYVPNCNGSQPLAIKGTEPTDVAEKIPLKVNPH